MFKKEDVEAFRSIRAPEDLKEKILAAHRAEEAAAMLRRVRIIKQLSAAAACMLFAIALSVIWLGQRSDIAVHYDGMPISEVALTIPETDLTVLPKNDERTVGAAPTAFRLEDSDPAAYDSAVRIPLDLTLDRKTTLRFSDGAVTLWDPETDELLSTDLCYTTDRDIRVEWELPAEPDDKEYTLELVRSERTDLLTLTCEESGWTLRCEEHDGEANDE